MRAPAPAPGGEVGLPRADAGRPRALRARARLGLSRSQAIVHAGDFSESSVLVDLLAVIHDAGPAKGRLERLRARFPDADAVVFGLRTCRSTRARRLQIFNPGSPTERRRAPHRSIGEATIAGGRIEFCHLRLD